MVAPKLNSRRAQFVLGRIDEILSWERATEQDRDAHFVELGRYLCEVRTGQYWRWHPRNFLKDSVKKNFPGPRRKAYYLMAIHERLPKPIHSGLKQLGWTKARELARVARSEGQNFNCAPWVHKASTMPKEE